MVQKAFLAVLLVLGFALSAHAAGPPPTIDDIDGATFTVRASGVEYDLNGQRFKSDVTIEWTITKTGATTVSFDSVFGGMSFDASYAGGFLMSSVSGEFGSLLYAAVSGAPGKLKLKGELTVIDPPPDFQVLRVLKVSGSQLVIQ